MHRRCLVRENHPRSYRQDREENFHHRRRWLDRFSSWRLIFTTKPCLSSFICSSVESKWEKCTSRMRRFLKCSFGLCQDLPGMCSLIAFYNLFPFTSSYVWFFTMCCNIFSFSVCMYSRPNIFLYLKLAYVCMLLFRIGYNSKNKCFVLLCNT